MTSPCRALAAVVTAAVLLGAAACSSDGSSRPVTRPAQGAPSTQSDAQAAAQQADGGDSPVGGATYVRARKARVTVTLGPDGFGADDIDVSVGDVVRFTAGSGGPYRLVVGGLAAHRVRDGQDAYVSFTQPGTYRLREAGSGATATLTAD